MNLRALARQYHQGTTDKAAYRKARAELIETALHDSGGDDTTGMEAGVDTTPAGDTSNADGRNDDSESSSSGQGDGGGGNGAKADAAMEAEDDDAATVVAPRAAPAADAAPDTGESGKNGGNVKNEGSEAASPEARALPTGDRARQRRMATAPERDGYRRRLLVLTIVVAVLVILGLTVDFGALLS